MPGRNDERYPLTADLNGLEVEVELMTAADERAVLDFACTVPPHDLLFLRRDITHPKVMQAWVRRIEEGTIVSLLARRLDQLVGCSAVVRDDLSWSPHVGELRVLVAPGGRERGLGTLLIQESLAIARGLGLEKISAQMTVDQKAAIAAFEGFGFEREALLHQHVRDGSGRKHDMAILALDATRIGERTGTEG